MSWLDTSRITLIDSLKTNTTMIEGKWYIARPKLPPLLSRVLHAWVVITGQAQAVIFKQDLVDLERKNHQDKK